MCSAGRGRAASRSAWFDTRQTLAICRYAKAGQMYRFSCDESWETVGDETVESIQDAIDRLPDQYTEVQADWRFT